MKSICLFMSVVMFLCMGIPAQAAEKEEVCENAVYSIGLDEMNVGDTKILRQDEDGTLSVTLVSIEIKEEITRGQRRKQRGHYMNLKIQIGWE